MLIRNLADVSARQRNDGTGSGRKERREERERRREEAVDNLRQERQYPHVLCTCRILRPNPLTSHQSAYVRYHAGTHTDLNTDGERLYYWGWASPTDACLTTKYRHHGFAKQGLIPIGLCVARMHQWPSPGLSKHSQPALKLFNLGPGGTFPTPTDRAKCKISIRLSSYPCRHVHDTKHFSGHDKNHMIAGKAGC
jgi:hypothetical protein